MRNFKYILSIASFVLAFMLLSGDLAAQEDNTSDLILSPDTLIMNLGDTSDLILSLDLHGPGNMVDGVEVYIDFDSAAFEVISIEDIYGFQFELIKDTMDSRIRFAAGILSQAPISEDTDLLKIRIRSKSFVENAGFVIDNDDEGSSSEVAMLGGFPSLANTFPSIVSTKGLCFNANGEAFRTKDSTFFVQDTNFNGGIGVLGLEEIEETEDDLLFQTAREGEFSYTIPLPSGRYQTQFFYAEFNELGESRLMDITSEELQLRTEFDIEASADGINKALIDTALIDVLDDTLNLVFTRSILSQLDPLLSGLCLDLVEPEELLPVELATFTASLREDYGLLNWETYQELAFSHYEVQKSTNQSKWSTLGLVNGGASKYEFKDRALSSGVSYYRLKMVDLNGTYEYSDIVSLAKSESNIKLLVFPNPASDELFIEFENPREEELSYFLLNTLGQSIAIERGSDVDHKRFDISAFPSGQYFLQVRNENKVVASKAVIVR